MNAFGRAVLSLWVLVHLGSSGDNRGGLWAVYSTVCYETKGTSGCMHFWYVAFAPLFEHKWWEVNGVLTVHAIILVEQFSSPHKLVALLDSMVGSFKHLLFSSDIMGCQRVGTPGLGSRLSAYWPTEWSKKWWCNKHNSVDQTPIPCVPVASLGLTPKGSVWRADAPALTNETGLAWAAKPINAATPGLGTSLC